MSAKREREEIQIDTETQVPQAKRSKLIDEAVKDQVLEKLRLKEIVNLFNKRVNRVGSKQLDIERFFCYQCKDLCVGESNSFLIGTEEEDYCDDCTLECEGCGDRYCEDLAHRHEDCMEEDEEEEEEDLIEEGPTRDRQGRKV